MRIIVDTHYHTLKLEPDNREEAFRLGEVFNQHGNDYDIASSSEGSLLIRMRRNEPEQEKLP